MFCLVPRLIGSRLALGTRCCVQIGAAGRHFPSPSQARSAARGPASARLTSATPRRSGRCSRTTPTRTPRSGTSPRRCRSMRRWTPRSVRPKGKKNNNKNNNNTCRKWCRVGSGPDAGGHRVEGGGGAALYGQNGESAGGAAPTPTSTATQNNKLPNKISSTDLPHPHTHMTDGVACTCIPCRRRRRHLHHATI